MIKTYTLNASKLGYDFQNLLLFLGRKHILSVMHPIVRPIFRHQTMRAHTGEPKRYTQSPPARYFTKHIKNFGKGTQ